MDSVDMLLAYRVGRWERPYRIKAHGPARPIGSAGRCFLFNGPSPGHTEDGRPRASGDRCTPVMASLYPSRNLTLRLLAEFPPWAGSRVSARIRWSLAAVA
jgi:hypothetical protein